MLRKYESQIVLAIFAFWVIGFSFQAGRSTQHQEDRKQVEAAHKSSNGIQGEKRANDGDPRPSSPTNSQTENRSNEAPEVTFVWLKLGEGLLVFVTVWLVLVTKALVEGAEITAKRQLRAYVLASSAKAKNFGSVEKPFEAVVVVKNSGKSPASDVIAWVGVQIGTFPDPGTLGRPPADLHLSKGVMGPGEKSEFTAIVNQPMLPADLARIRSGSVTVYIFGEIEYLDIFNKKQFSAFRFTYGGPGGEDKKGKTSNAADGNRAT
jgi:hypothetical protein